MNKLKHSQTIKNNQQQYNNSNNSNEYDSLNPCSAYKQIARD